ncbi:MAG: DUF2161 family putative PD-(D/E)XK-type phosphodiesterase [Planctomycetota bacterium]
MTGKPIRETDLYPPVKALLEAQGYEVKGEVGKADVVACRGDAPPIVVELKTGFSLTLFHQAIDRLALTDVVYVAVPHGTGKRFADALKRNRTLCRRLGLGLITVRLSTDNIPAVALVHLDPAPYAPRKSAPRTDRLLREFARRVGDPNAGGLNRATLMTAYRQDALRCLGWLAAEGPTKASRVAEATGVAIARRIMADDHYGWFERVSLGVYGASPRGKEAAEEHRSAIAALTEPAA